MYHIMALKSVILISPIALIRGVLTPNFGRYVPQQSEKWGAPDRARAWKCRALEWAWGARAWKCRSPELTAGCLWLALWPAANPGAPQQSEKCEALEQAERARAWKYWAPERVRLSKLAVGGDKWLERTEISKIMISVSEKNVKWWCSGTEYFDICKNDMLRTGNLGLKIIWMNFFFSRTKTNLIITWNIPYSLV